MCFGIFTSCSKDPEIQKKSGLPDLIFPEVVHPVDNQPNAIRWELGKKLFYDRALSRDSSISCASCHNPDLAFSDKVSFSKGVDGLIGTRNAPTLGNVAYHPYYTREGGVKTLEMQILVPVQEHNEFDFNIVEIGYRLAKDSNYVQLAKRAYDRNPDYFVITRAISVFERSLISKNSRFDQYLNGNKTILNNSEIQGANLFYSSKTGCSGCHDGFNFSNYSFENNGLYINYTDPGRKRLTGKSADEALFKVPTLRNIELTAPYMHDGSFNDLKSVINHYNSGGQNHPHKSELIRPLHLTEYEMDCLVAFLKSLTDESFINNPIFHE